MLTAKPAALSYWSLERFPALGRFRLKVVNSEGNVMETSLIIANIRSDKLEDVEKRLERMGVERINVSKVKGFGEYHNFFGSTWLSTEVRIEIFTKKDEVEAITLAIIDAAHTGHPGDGVVAVLPIEKLYLIRSRSEATTENFWPRAAP